MALEMFDKLRINKFLKITGLEDIYYGGFYEGVRKNKYNDKDVLSFLVDTFLSKLSDSSTTTDKLLIKYIVWIDNFYGWVCESYGSPSDDIIAKIRIFKNSYLEYVDRFELECNNEIIGCIDSLVSEIEKLHGKVDEEEVSAYVASITALEVKISSLEADLGKASTEIGNLQRRLADEEKKGKKNIGTINELRETIQSKEKEIREQLKLIDELKGKIINFEERANVSKEEYENIIKEYKALEESNNSLMETHMLLLSEFCELQKDNERKSNELGEFIRLQEVREEQRQREYISRVREKSIDEYVVSLLIGSKLTIDEIGTLLSKHWNDITRDDINNSLKRIRREFNLINPNTASFPRQFSICAPNIVTNGSFDLNVTSKVMNVMVISDLHLTDVSDDVVRTMDLVYDYCKKMGIELIMNLGDLLAINENFNVSKNIFTENNKLIDSILTRFPYDSGITHAILGGNHDKGSLNLGVDLLSKLESNRDDFISLGYDHCNVNIVGSSSNDFFGLHHPSRRLLDSIDDYKLGAKKLISHLDWHYPNEEERKKAYIDLFGHFHVSRLDMLNQYCSVPSLFKDRESNGAWHMKIYFDEKNNIKHMVFIPLAIDNKITQVSEIGYQRVLK